jgi:hypothetical protein
VVFGAFYSVGHCHQVLAAAAWVYWFRGLGRRCLRRVVELLALFLFLEFSWLHKYYNK